VAARVDQSLSRLELGNQLETTIKAFIYASAEDVQGAILFSGSNTLGRAFTSYNIVLIGISPDRLESELSGLTHELAHLLVNEVTFNCLGWLDPWLAEGLAMYAEGPLEPYFQTALDAAITGDELISVRSLSSGFPAGHAGSTLSYAESYSLVAYLIDGYGWGKMRDLLAIFKGGSTTDKALRAVYGFDRDGLDRLWRNHVKVK